MASAGNYAGGGNAVGPLPARRRRIDDVRQLQQRRRQALPVVPHQQNEEISPMRAGKFQQQHGYCSHGDGNDMASSAPSSSAASPSRSHSSTRSSRSRLSAKRQNMMARRIEMRRRNEERQRQQIQEGRGQEPQLRHQQQQTGARANQHYSNDGQGQATQQHHAGVAQSQSRHQHVHHHHQQQPPRQQQCHGQSIMKPPATINPSGVDYYASQQQHEHHDNQHQASSQQPWQGQQNYDRSQTHQPRPVQQQQHHGPSPQQQQYFHTQNAPQYNQQPQQHQAQQNQYFRAQSQESPMPMAIPSPPVLQRTRQRYAQIPVNHDNSMGGVENNEAGRANKQIYNQAELEQSGIIRNSASAPRQETNRLKKYSSHDSPSDEWQGFNSINNGFNQVQPQRNQYEQQQHPRPNGQMLQQQKQFQPRHNAQMEPYHDRNVGHHGVLKNPSVQGINTKRNGYPHNVQESQKQPRYPQHNQQQLQHQQYQYHNQPNWNDINQQYHDDYRQRVYQQRQSASRQQYHQEMQQGIKSGQSESQHPKNPHQHVTSSNYTPRQRHMSTFSPMEHLGNRADQINRKNNFVSPEREHKHHQHVNENIEGEESIVSVSEQARKFEKQGERTNPQPSPMASGLTNSNTADEEATSVASLRKGWEGSYARKDQRQSKTVAVSDTRTTNGSPFGVWVERANRLARQRRRDERREQKKSIEDRWMSQHRNNVQSLPLPEKRQGGYQSEGEMRTLKRQSGRGNASAQYASDGYQSEGQELVRGRDRYHDGYHSDGVGMDQGQEDEYDPDSLSILDVETEAITPNDARRRLWDQKERLRAVLPTNDSFESIGDARDRWPEHKMNNIGSPAHSGISSPSNFSGSMSGGRLFKSKFVHAAALATQRGSHIVESNDGRSQHSQTHSQHNRTQQQHQNREYYETQQNQQQQRQRAEQHTTQHQRSALPQHAQQSQQHDFTSKKSYSQKNAAISSHYTDSTAETTADFTATPTGSYGSQHRHAAANDAAVQQESSNALRSVNNVVHKVSPSPPKRPSAQAMPPIAEQVVPAPQPPSSQAQNTSSVADLIARINSVSRSNPEEALAAIQSIINREGGTDGNGVGGMPPLRKAMSQGEPQLKRPQITQRPLPQPPGASTKDPIPFSPSRNDLISPSFNNKAKGNDTKVQHLGKAFFQEKYEDVLRNDSEQVLRGSRRAINFADTAVLGDRQEDEDASEDDEDDSLLSSDDSTVSSMTNPTYLSLRSEQVASRKPAPPTTSSSQQRAGANPMNLTANPQKSWNTLKEEYKTRQSPRDSKDDHEDMRQVVKDGTSSSDGDIGLDKFNPDAEQTQRRFVEYQKNQHVKQLHPVKPQGSQQLPQHQQHRQQQQRQQQPQNLIRSSTNDFSIGICGVNYLGFAKSDSRQSQMSSGLHGTDVKVPPSLPTPSTLTDAAWVPNPKRNDMFGNSTKQRRENVVRRQVAAAPKQQLGSRNVATDQVKTNSRSPVADAAPPRIPSSQSKPRHTQPDRINMPELVTTPKLNCNVPQKRASTPEIMMAMSDAFSNVNISLEGTSVRPSSTMEKSRLIRPSQDNDPPLQHLTSSEGEEEEDPVQSLQTISEAFSNVDIPLEQEKTVSQHRKELEYLAKSWTASSQSNGGSGNDKGRGNNSDISTSFVSDQCQAPNAVAATWAQDPKKAPRTNSVTAISKQKKKRVEPSLRLKGNKSLAQKFASLVKAYDD